MTGAAEGRAMTARVWILMTTRIQTRAFCVSEDRAMVGRTERLRSELGEDLESLVAGWVRRVIHHVALDMLRQRRPLFSLDDLTESTHEIAAEPEGTDPYDLALLRTDLTRALSRLPAHYREPIQLHLLQGLPQDQVGQRLGRPRSTVATQIERGLGRLRRTLVGLDPATC